MITSEKGIELIKHFEGFRSDAYLDQGDLVTIGYGTTLYPNGQSVMAGDTCTLEEALEYLKYDIQRTERGVNNLLKVNLTQYQFDSLVSFAYNAGLNALRTSTLLKIINEHRTDVSIEDAFLMWVKVTVNGKKQTSKGLVNRRKSEAWLFLHNELKFPK